MTDNEKEENVIIKLGMFLGFILAMYAVTLIQGCAIRKDEVELKISNNNRVIQELKIEEKR